MVKILILFYLNIKDTHGYEIQKFIQASGFDNWTNIKAGSIYYALSKMEKAGEIELVREETRGSRIRRIYRITDSGKNELKKAIEKELDKPLVPLNIDKFILPSTFNKLDKDVAIKIIESHMKELNKTLEYWNYWRNVKINGDSPLVEKISFDMTICNYEYELKWCKALIEEFDLYYKLSEKNEVMIKNFHFSEMEDNDKKNIDINKASVNQLKDIILNNSYDAKDALEKLITVIGNK
ncbi:PadR family transcriptional regulator [Clostridium estertheticum]|uniref:PadR family transcriptional regulator n=1 Tax=Clostridium estertheticum TaxID=238834 RepID=UPI001C7CA8C2|nr:PadR family transcriptional regulator [Clostridium estertheticum]MBX4271620.1 PadR family transcriptional regulator [Clostridium estertheticum]WLC82119.1 PadR family transcriptional regulator [Clostridium estertheticum]